VLAIRQRLIRCEAPLTVVARDHFADHRVAIGDGTAEGEPEGETGSEEGTGEPEGETGSEEDTRPVPASG
jgi:hypothetical protein